MGGREEKDEGGRSWTGASRSGTTLRKRIHALAVELSSATLVIKLELIGDRHGNWITKGKDGTLAKSSSGSQGRYGEQEGRLVRLTEISLAIGEKMELEWAESVLLIS